MIPSRRVCLNSCGFLLALGIGLLAEGKAAAQRNILIPGLNGVQTWTVGYSGFRAGNGPAAVGGATNTLQPILQGNRVNFGAPRGLVGGVGGIGAAGGNVSATNSSTATFRGSLAAGPGSLFIASSSTNPRVLIGNAGGPFNFNIGFGGKSGGMNGMSGGGY